MRRTIAFSLLLLLQCQPWHFPHSRHWINVYIFVEWLREWNNGLKNTSQPLNSMEMFSVLSPVSYLFLTLVSLNSWWTQKGNYIRREYCRELSWVWFPPTTFRYLRLVIIAPALSCGILSFGKSEFYKNVYVKSVSNQLFLKFYICKCYQVPLFSCLQKTWCHFVALSVGE